jgi:hypothetical protein
MSKTVYVEARKDEKPDAILCEHPDCETYYEGEAGTQHVEQYPTHVVTPLRLEVR